MRRLLAYPLSIIYYIFFVLTLVVFHPIQWICLHWFGYQAHHVSVYLLNRCLMFCTYILGTRYDFTNPYSLPKDRPLIIVSNHQSMYDIPPIIWYLRDHHPKFVSKKELGKGIPSVSFNLRHGGSVLIDRKDSRQALQEISKLGEYIEENKRSAVIFPEGTRSRNGVPKKFQTTGLKVLMKRAPSSVLVPLCINNSWKMLRYGKFPLEIGVHMKFQIYDPKDIEGSPEELIRDIEETIKNGVVVTP